MPDIRIHREHALGLAQARKIAWQWAEEVEEQFGMECSVLEGESSDTVEFKRSGVNGELIVAADHFDLHARLGFLLGAFCGHDRTGDPRQPRQAACRERQGHAGGQGRPARRSSRAYFSDSIRSTYSCIASSALLPFCSFQASHLARPTMSVKPGRLPSTSPPLACLKSA